MRSSLSKRIQASIFKRDCWCCRYCGIEVIFSVALKAMDSINPEHGYYHRNGKREKMARLLLDRCACVDHIVPVSSGGSNNPENLLCSCWRCNTLKGSDSADVWSSRIIAKESLQVAQGWDGFLGIVKKLEPDNEWLKYF